MAKEMSTKNKWRVEGKNERTKREERDERSERKKQKTAAPTTPQYVQTYLHEVACNPPSSCLSARNIYLSTIAMLK